MGNGCNGGAREGVITRMLRSTRGEVVSFAVNPPQPAGHPVQLCFVFQPQNRVVDEMRPEDRRLSSSDGVGTCAQRARLLAIGERLVVNK